MALTAGFPTLTVGCLRRYSPRTLRPFLGCHSRLYSPLLRRSISSYLTSPRELYNAIKTSPSSATSLEPRVIPLCVSWFPDNDQESRTGIQTFCQKRIPEARFFDLDIVIDTESPFPRLLPSALGLASSMSGLGIRKEDILVVYDTSELGIFSAPRVGWMLKVFGHPKVHILNNFRLWVEQGLPTEQGEIPSFKRCIYPVPTIDEGKIATYEEVLEAVMDHNKEGREGIQVLDSRSSDDFSGKYPGPRPDSLSGHMPGSINIPYDLVLDTETKAFLPSDQLAKLFKAKGVDPLKPIISSGTSITAYVIETALHEAQWGSSDSLNGRKEYGHRTIWFGRRILKGQYGDIAFMD
ncbi:hypothetical protein ACJA88_014984 [Fusarium oxysporum]